MSKDSGYMGSESSRRVAASDKSRGGQQGIPRTGTRPLGRITKALTDKEEEAGSSSAESQSTVEERILAYKPGTKSKKSSSTMGSQKSSSAGKGRLTSSENVKIDLPGDRLVRLTDNISVCGLPHTLGTPYDLVTPRGT